MTLLRLAARCPRCNHRPNYRVYRQTAEKYAALDPASLVATVQCHRCGKIYPIRAGAYHAAEPVRRSS